MKTFFILLISIISSCNNTSQNRQSTDSIAAKNDSIKTGKNTISNNELNDSIIHIRFPKDSTSITISMKMKGINNPLTVLIPIKQGKQLTALLKADDSLANIRINQIFTPDGKADGPFGKELTRAIRQQGMYKLIIAENMMQGDEWKGNFKLTVRVE